MEGGVSPRPPRDGPTGVYGDETFNEGVTGEVGGHPGVGSTGSVIQDLSFVLFLVKIFPYYSFC